MTFRPLLFALICLPLAAQDRGRVPVFPPDMIAHDSPIRDLAKIDAKHVRVDTDNARLRVLRIALGAGEALPLHDARDGVLVCLAACRLTVTNPVGYAVEVKLEAGQTQWMPAARHRILNAAPGPVEFLYIEAKRPAN